MCISILHSGADSTGYEAREERWSPVQSVEKVLLSVMSVIADPNPDSPANIDAAKLLRADRDAFALKAQEDVMRSFEES